MKRDRGNFCSTYLMRIGRIWLEFEHKSYSQKKNETVLDTIISKRKSKYYRLGCRTLPSIIVIDKIVIVLENKEKRHKEMIDIYVNLIFPVQVKNSLKK